MKAVLLSINPRWCELIASGRKTMEVRKTRPKLETPFKVYIYCTKDNTDHVPSKIWWKSDKTGFQHILNGKVIGEFVCDAILGHCEMANADIAEVQGCIRRENLLQYANGKELFGWHISDLVIYDQPKKLSEFYKSCATQDCLTCQFFKNDDCETEPLRRLKRAPQDWCYVEKTRFRDIT